MTYGVRPTFERAALSAVAISIMTLYGAAWTSGHHKLFWRTKLKSKAEVVLALPAPEEMAVVQGRIPPQRGGPSARTIRNAFDQIDYSLEAVGRGDAEVPQLELSAVPHDLQRITDTETRKDVFLRMMLPLVLKVNDEIRADRRRLQGFQRRMARREPLARADAEWVAEMAARYKLDPSVSIGRLLKRVDIVPPSLALAQSANESGWGTSRFARRGNALFGQWTSGGDSGMVPRARDSDKNHHVKTFDTPLEAVRAYVRNLNTHGAYDPFRDARAQERSRGAEPNGGALVGTLESYANSGPEYVAMLKRVMRANDLDALDEARLSMKPAELTF